MLVNINLQHGHRFSSVRSNEKSLIKKNISDLDLHLLICLFPAGAWFCIKELNDERVFIVLYAVFASYFAGVMIRLMLTLTPCVCVLGRKKKFY